MSTTSSATTPTAPTTPASTEAVRVLYLAGHGRSGSTIIGQTLGELPGAAFVGEINFFWSDAVLGDRPCGCRAGIRDCRQWSAVLDGLDFDVVDAARVVTAVLRRTTRTRHGLQALLPSGADRPDPELAEAGHYIRALYRSVAEVFDADLVIDSSKSPMYARLLDATRGIDLSLLHLVRDPRATAHSWRTPKREAVGGSELPSFGVAESAALWTVANLLATRPVGWREPMRLRYEDFIADPVGQIHRIARRLGRDPADLPISADGLVTLGTSHTIAGNPDRFSTGPISLVADDRWRAQVSAVDYLVVTALTLPGLRRYGYPIRTGQPTLAAIGAAKSRWIGGRALSGRPQRSH